MNKKKLSQITMLALGLTLFTACGGGGTTATNQNTAPIADAGTDRIIKNASLFVLDGSQSKDADADTLTYTWKIVSKPQNSTSSLENNTTFKPRFRPDERGIYVISLTVNDGKVDSQTTEVSYTAKQFNSTHYEKDNNGDGTVNYKKTYTYDANGNRLSYEEDSNANDTVNYISTYTYDANGNRLTRASDSNGDGTINRKTTYTYDDNGNRLTDERDNNNDGAVDYKSTYTYDANGNRLTYVIDNNNNGTVNRRDTYTYDANDNLLSYEKDSNADGTVDEKDTYIYDDNGNILTYEEDSNADGIVDYKVIFTYDANGIRKTATIEETGSKEIRNYDSYGNEILIRKEVLNQPVTIETYIWQGFY